MSILKKGSGKGIKWDEEIIAEHDKERGTRQKIEEPKTPFHYGEEEEGISHESINVESINEKLKSHNDKLEWEGHERSEKMEKKRAFEEKRKVHYNEYEKMKKAKLTKETEDDVEEGEGEVEGEEERVEDGYDKEDSKEEGRK